MANRFVPISSKATWKNASQQINRNFQALDAETNTKTISAGGGNKQMISGKLPDGRYGDVYYDSSNIDRILIGQDSDGEPIIAITASGYSVLEET